MYVNPNCVQYPVSAETYKIQKSNHLKRSTLHSNIINPMSMLRIPNTDF